MYVLHIFIMGLNGNLFSGQDSSVDNNDFFVGHFPPP